MHRSPAPPQSFHPGGHPQPRHGYPVRQGGPAATPDAAPQNKDKTIPPERESAAPPRRLRTRCQCASARPGPWPADPTPHGALSHGPILAASLPRIRVAGASAGPQTTAALPLDQRRASPACARARTCTTPSCISGCNSLRNDSIAPCKKPSPAEEGPAPAHPAPPQPPPVHLNRGTLRAAGHTLQEMSWITEPIRHAPEAHPVALWRGPGSTQARNSAEAIDSEDAPQPFRPGQCLMRLARERLSSFRGSDYARPARASLANR